MNQPRSQSADRQDLSQLPVYAPPVTFQHAAPRNRLCRAHERKHIVCFEAHPRPPPPVTPSPASTASPESFSSRVGGWHINMAVTGEHPAAGWLVSTTLNLPPTLIAQLVCNCVNIFWNYIMPALWWLPLVYNCIFLSWLSDTVQRCFGANCNRARQNTFFQPEPTFVIGWAHCRVRLPLQYKCSLSSCFWFIAQKSGAIAAHNLFTVWKFSNYVRTPFPSVCKFIRIFRQNQRKK